VGTRSIANGAQAYGLAGLRLAETLFAFGKLGAPWTAGKPVLTPARLRVAFEGLGATYVKIGQFIASAPSMFPPEFVKAFQGCLDRTPSLPYSVIERELRRELGRDPLECFATIDTVPLASASVAQVHAARLHSGQEVVLKVQRPGVDIKLRTDVKAIQVVLKLLESIYPVIARTGASSIAQDMERTFTDECDFRIESRRMAAFAEFCGRLRLHEAVVPNVYEELSTSRVLVMERLHGQPLSADPSQMRLPKDRLAAAVAKAMNVWVSSVTHCEFFHADVHAGNLLVLDDGRVGFIDFGIVGTIQPKSWQGALSLVTALIRADARGVAESLVQVGATHQDVRTDLLARDLEIYLGRVSPKGRARGPDAGGETPDQLLMEVFGAGEKYGLHFPRELFLLLKQYLYLDRYLRLVSPGLVDVLALGSFGQKLFR
jgi:predicted unusual protein kinase regulating ubiquinone biosynthesis (AarF/ABC1/UbiB family)